MTRMNDGRTLYRSRRGMILGVCRGIADYLAFPVFLVRLGFIVGFFMSGFFPALLVYFVAAILMKPEPPMAYESDYDRELRRACGGSRPISTAGLRSTYDNIERRIERLEGVVTSRDFSWEGRLNQ